MTEEKMIRTYKEVPKQAKNSIVSHLDNLIKKYGEKSVRLVSSKYFEKLVREKKLKEEIKKREEELAKLKTGVKK